MAAMKPAESCVRYCLRVLTIVLFGCRCNAFVQELDDRFRNLKEEGSWFVEFYAPWCGYCQKLEPIWAEVGRTLQGSSVQVAKLDATRFSDIAREFGVRGYPSIKFIKGQRVITYEGERAVQELVQFAEKASRPAVVELQDTAQMRRVIKEKSVCFFLITTTDSPELSKNLKVMYTQVAEDKVVQSYFYQVDFNAIPTDIAVQAPAIVVAKDDSFFTYEVPEDVSKQNISEWVDNERFEAFIHVTKSNFHDIAETGKVMMLAIFAEKKSKKKANERISKVVKAVSQKEREKFHRHFQFGWMLGDAIAANIMMSSLTAPFLMAYNTTDHVYYLKYYSELKDDFTEQQLVSFLDDILEGRAKGYGGDSYFQRIYRGIWDLLRTIYDIWTTQPIAALLMFGFPLLVFSFVIYMLCIADPGNEDEDLDELNDEGVDLLDDINEEKEIDESEEAINSAKPKTD